MAAKKRKRKAKPKIEKLFVRRLTDNPISETVAFPPERDWNEYICYIHLDNGERFRFVCRAPRPPAYWALAKMLNVKHLMFEKWD